MERKRREGGQREEEGGRGRKSQGWGEKQDREVNMAAKEMNKVYDECTSYNEAMNRCSRSRDCPGLKLRASSAPLPVYRTSSLRIRAKTETPSALTSAALGDTSGALARDVVRCHGSASLS